MCNFTPSFFDIYIEGQQLFKIGGKQVFSLKNRRLSPLSSIPEAFFLLEEYLWMN